MFTVPVLPTQARCARPQASPQSISRPALAQAKRSTPDQDGVESGDQLDVPDQDVNEQGALGRPAGRTKVPIGCGSATARVLRLPHGARVPRHKASPSE